MDSRVLTFFLCRPIRWQGVFRRTRGTYLVLTTKKYKSMKKSIKNNWTIDESRFLMLADGTIKIVARMRSGIYRYLLLSPLGVRGNEEESYRMYTDANILYNCYPLPYKCRKELSIYFKRFSLLCSAKMVERIKF